MEIENKPKDELVVIVQKRYGGLLERFQQALNGPYPQEEVPITNPQIELAFVLTHFKQKPMFTSPNVEKFSNALRQLKRKLAKRAKTVSGQLRIDAISAATIADTLDAEIIKLEAEGESTLGSREDRDQAYGLAGFFKEVWYISRRANRIEIGEK